MYMHVGNTSVFESSKICCRPTSNDDDDVNVEFIFKSKNNKRVQNKFDMKYNFQRLLE